MPRADDATSRRGSGEPSVADQILGREQCRSESYEPFYDSGSFSCDYEHFYDSGSFSCGYSDGTTFEGSFFGVYCKGTIFGSGSRR